MGLIKAALGAVKGTIADQWKEYFYCDAMDSDVLVVKGQKRVSGLFGKHSGSDNIITEDSVIAVADGQCMMIVENGKVVDVCAEPGEYIYDKSSEPSIFSGSLGEGVRRTFDEIGRRFTYGGEAAKDQRVYYFNTKEIVGNKYGTPTPVPFRVIDRNIGLDVDISIRCNGEYSYRIADPILFYTNVCGNVAGYYNRSELDGMLKAELLTALQPAFARISEMGIRYSALPGHTLELSEALNEVLSKKWKELRGIVVASFGVNSVSASKEDEDMIKQLQKSAVMRDPNMAAAALVGAQADAMRAAAANSAGAMNGFMGMNMAGAAGGMNPQSLYEMGQKNVQKIPAAGTSEWTCGCGTVNTGKFCSSCGAKRPEAAWTCSCGTVNTGNFCSECGAKRPEAEWICSCGTKNTGRFCSECGKPRD